MAAGAGSSTAIVEPDQLALFQLVGLVGDDAIALTDPAGDFDTPFPGHAGSNLPQDDVAWGVDDGAFSAGGGPGGGPGLWCLLKLLVGRRGLQKRHVRADL